MIAGKHDGDDIFLMRGSKPSSQLRLVEKYLFRVISTCSCILFSLTGCKGPHEQGIDYQKGKGLIYIEDQFGNRIPDYSMAGFQNG